MAQTEKQKPKKTKSTQNSFSPLVKEKLAYYVYRLIDPRNNQTFYIGKGIGDRIFSHELEARRSKKSSPKLDRIREIINSGLQIKHIIHRHGLTEEQAFHVEAALIDMYHTDGYREHGDLQTDNHMAGHHSRDIGVRDVSEAIASYEAEQADIRDEAVLININQKYRSGMTDAELYDATRKCWRCSPLKYKATHAYAVKEGLIKAVYQIREWYPSVEMPGRWEFNGLLDVAMTRRYLNKSVRMHMRRGNQNPIRWINAKT